MALELLVTLLFFALAPPVYAMCAAYILLKEAFK